MNKLKLSFNKARNKYYAYMMEMCLRQYFRSKRMYWFKLFSRYFDKLYKNKNLRMVSCEFNKTES